MKLKDGLEKKNCEKLARLIEDHINKNKVSEYEPRGSTQKDSLVLLFSLQTRSRLTNKQRLPRLSSKTLLVLMGRSHWVHSRI